MTITPFLTAFSISIHALQTECDPDLGSIRIVVMDFYPRTPNGVRPLVPPASQLTAGIFLSTHSKRSATVEEVLSNPDTIIISIHALQTECDGQLVSH